MAVHAGVERNVCNIVVSTETPPNHHQSVSNAAPHVQISTLTPAPLPSPHLQYPTTISSAFLRRCATDASVRPRPPSQHH